MLGQGVVEEGRAFRFLVPEWNSVPVLQYQGVYYVVTGSNLW